MLPRRGVRSSSGTTQSVAQAPGAQLLPGRVAVHASTDDAPAVVNAATEMTTTEPEDLGARLGVNPPPARCAAESTGAHFAAALETAEEEAAVDGGFFATHRDGDGESAAVCCGRRRRRAPPLPLYLLLCLPPPPLPPPEEGGERGRARCRPARPRRPAPSLTAACRALSPLPCGWSRYQVSPRSFTPREDGAGL